MRDKKEIGKMLRKLENLKGSDDCLICGSLKATCSCDSGLEWCLKFNG